MAALPPSGPSPAGSGPRRPWTRRAVLAYAAACGFALVPVLADASVAAWVSFSGVVAVGAASLWTRRVGPGGGGG